MGFDEERKRVVDSLVRRGYLSDKKVIHAMLSVPRELFLPERNKLRAYVDSPQEIGAGQTISAPHMVAIMAEKLDLKKGHRVLEIGGGSGYHAAVVSKIVGKEGHVYSVERIDALTRRGRNNIAKSGLSDIVTIVTGDGSEGLEEFAPYDRIFVACAAPDIPPPIIKQLKDGGKLLIPVGVYVQTLIMLEKRGKKIIKKDYGGCVFVPLIGKYGFDR